MMERLNEQQGNLLSYSSGMLDHVAFYSPHSLAIINDVLFATPWVLFRVLYHSCSAFSFLESKENILKVVASRTKLLNECLTQLIHSYSLYDVPAVL